MRGRSGKDRGFRYGSGAFGLILIALVCTIGVVLVEQSMPSIERFGAAFLRTRTWDPVANEFGAFAFIWGTLYSSILALIIATPVALGIAIFSAELCPMVLRQPLMFVTDLLAAIPS